MSQYYTQYGDYESPTSGRLDRPLASTSVDENGYHFFPHSSSSVYDDPEESKLLSELEGEAQNVETMDAEERGEGQSTFSL